MKQLLIGLLIVLAFLVPPASPTAASGPCYVDSTSHYVFSGGISMYATFKCSSSSSYTFKLRICRDKSYDIDPCSSTVSKSVSGSGATFGLQMSCSSSSSTYYYYLKASYVDNASGISYGLGNYGRFGTTKRCF